MFSSLSPSEQLALDASAALVRDFGPYAYSREILLNSLWDTLDATTHAAQRKSLDALVSEVHYSDGDALGIVRANRNIPGRKRVPAIRDKAATVALEELDRRCREWEESRAKVAA